MVLRKWRCTFKMEEMHVSCAKAVLADSPYITANWANSSLSNGNAANVGGGKTGLCALVPQSELLTIATREGLPYQLLFVLLPGLYPCP
jgi:hypothetical protein